MVTSSLLILHKVVGPCLLTLRLTLSNYRSLTKKGTLLCAQTGGWAGIFVTSLHFTTKKGHMEKQEMEVEWKLETENGNEIGEENIYSSLSNHNSTQVITTKPSVPSSIWPHTVPSPRSTRCLAQYLPCPCAIPRQQLVHFHFSFQFHFHFPFPVSIPLPFPAFPYAHPCLHYHNLQQDTAHQHTCTHPVQA